MTSPLWNGESSAPEYFESSQWLERLEGPRNRPVVGITWFEARAYARWLTRWLDVDGMEVRLPTESEWEKAARGGEGMSPNAGQRVYPWGTKFDASRCNGQGSDFDVVPVGCFPRGHGPYEAWDQAGNVWDWCADRVENELVLPPYPSAEAVDPLHDSNDAVARVLRGGSCWDVPQYLRVSCRSGLLPGNRVDLVGFRCVLAPRP